MSKRHLGLICLLYSGIFGYVVIFDKLKLFLAPGMQIYIKLSIIPMLLIGLVMLFNNKVHYKFKISDLVLLLPLIMLIFSGDGRLTASLANNKMTNFNSNQKTKTEKAIANNQESLGENKKDNEIIERETTEAILEQSTENYDFSNVDFNVIDASYGELSGYLTYAPKASKYEGKTIRVRGFTIKNASYLSEGYFAIGKYEISCCVADAAFTGFFAKYDTNKIKNDTWYEIEGILEKGNDKEGNDTMYIKVINIKEIDSKNEEQYVYPCYAYDNGTCAEISKYNLE